MNRHEIPIKNIYHETEKIFDFVLVKDGENGYLNRYIKENLPVPRNVSFKKIRDNNEIPLFCNLVEEKYKVFIGYYTEDKVNSLKIYAGKYLDDDIIKDVLHSIGSGYFEIVCRGSEVFSFGERIENSELIELFSNSDGVQLFSETSDKQTAYIFEKHRMNFFAILVVMSAVLIFVLILLRRTVLRYFYSLIEYSRNIVKSDSFLKRPKFFISEYELMARNLHDLQSDIYSVRDLYKNIICASQAPFIVLDSNKKIIVSNSRMDELIAKDTSEEMFECACYLCSGDNDCSLNELINDTIASDTEINRLTELTDAEGNSKHYMWKTSLVHGSRGEIDYVIMQGIDLTDLRTAQQKIEEYGTILSKALDISHIASWKWDTANSFIYFTHNSKLIFGDEDNKPLTEKDFFDLFKGKDAEKLAQEINRSLHTGNSVDVDLSMRSDEIKVYNLSAEIIKNEEGKVVEILGTLRNITEKIKNLRKLEEARQLLEERVLQRTEDLSEEIAVRKKKEKELIEAKKFLEAYKSAVDSINIVKILDPEGNIKYVNEKFKEVSGYSIDEVIGRNYNDVSKINLSEDEKEHFRERLASKQNWYGSLVKRKKNNEEYNVDISVVPILGENDEIKEYISVQHDVTILNKAIAAAKEAEQVKSRFLATMSHEIRTPLNGIMGFVDLLKETELNKIQNDYLSTIVESVKNLRIIIDDILDFSKIESGNVLVDKDSFCVHEVVDNVVELYSAKAAEKYIRILYFCDPGIPLHLYGDAQKLRQSLQNLLMNAVKFTPENGQIAVSVKQISYVEGKCRVYFSISDNGIGISQEKKDDILKEFTQSDVSVTRKFGGTGLGLAICSKYIEMMGGKLEFESREGEGSTFYFFLDMDVAEKSPIFNPKRTEGLKVAVTDILGDHETLSLVQTYLKCFGAESSLVLIEDLESCEDLFDLSLIIVGDSEKGVEEYLKTTGLYTIIVTDFEMKSKYASFENEDKRVVSLPFGAKKMADLLSGEKEKSVYYGSLIKTSSESRNISILVAEDNPVNQKLIEIMLAKAGVDFDIAQDGLEAFEKYIKGNYNIIFMDINMPGMDGLQATEKIRKYETDKNIPSIPIIALTANVLKEDIKSYIETGMTDFMGKPILKDKLIKMINNYTKGDGE
jgi:PAS domain S-box-containing protein